MADQPVPSENTGSADPQGAAPPDPAVATPSAEPVPAEPASPEPAPAEPAAQADRADGIVLETAGHYTRVTEGNSMVTVGDPGGLGQPRADKVAATSAETDGESGHICERAGGRVDRYAVGSMLHETDADWTVTARGLADVNITGDHTEDVGGNKTETVVGHYEVTCQSHDLNINGPETWTTIGTSLDLNISANAEVNVGAAGTVTVGAAMDITLALSVELKAAIAIEAVYGVELKLHGAAEVKTWAALGVELRSGVKAAASAAADLCVGMAKVQAMGAPVVGLAPVTLTM